MILPEPRRRERNQRQPEKQMQIRPQNPTRNLVAGMQHVMMIVPVNPHINKTEHITQENRQEWNERCNAVPLWRLQLQHHNRNDDRDPSIAKRLKPACPHPLLSPGLLNSLSAQPPL